MKAMPHVYIAVAATEALLVAACSAEQGGADGDAAAADRSVNSQAAEEAAAPAPVGTEVSKYVTDRGALFASFQQGGYKEFPVSDEMHALVGPHDDVRVLYNKTVADSLAAGKAEHPAGSMIVTEHYRKGEGELYGWSVSIKTHNEGLGGKGWYWIEFLGKVDMANVSPEQSGNGIEDCAACPLGKDLVRSSFPGG